MTTCLLCHNSHQYCTCRILRRGIKKLRTEFIRVRKGPIRRSHLKYPHQDHRSLLTRKAMVDADTHRIAMETLLGNAGDFTFLHSARKLTPLDDAFEFALKSNNVARCHIVADSNVRLIVEAIYARLREVEEHPAQQTGQMPPFSLFCPPRTVPADIYDFIQAMASPIEALSIQISLVDDIVKKSTANKASIMHSLSHGSRNLFFGDASINTDILHGLDVPLAHGKPTPNAAGIIRSINGLRIPSELKFSILQPTIRKDTGAALSSSNAEYASALRFEDAYPFGRPRSNSQ
ncbi:hypothetical protein ALP93_02845 [Pseudomonas syringae pv. helianthi]|nr:hypothetical protein ALP93_02845 [Pseudomonas syringae pv. helianthi]